VNRSSAVLNLGRPDEAEADATAAIALEPDPEALAVAYVNRSSAVLTLGRPDEAEADATAAIALEPDPETLARAYLYRFTAHQHLGRDDEAKANLVTVTRLLPSTHALHVLALEILGGLPRSLAAGRLVATGSEFTVAFTVPDGWTVQEKGLIVEWTPNGSIDRAVIGVYEFSGQVFEEPCGSRTEIHPTTIEQNADAFIAWLGSNTRFSSGEVAEVTIGAHRGLSIVGSPADEDDCSSDTHLLLFAIGDGPVFSLRLDTTASLTAIDVDERTFIVTVESGTTDWTRIESVGDLFLMSLEIR
jgi:hypothetical protein